MIDVILNTLGFFILFCYKYLKLYNLLNDDTILIFMCYFIFMSPVNTNILLVNNIFAFFISSVLLCVWLF